MPLLFLVSGATQVRAMHGEQNGASEDVLQLGAAAVDAA